VQVSKAYKEVAEPVSLALLEGTDVINPLSIVGAAIDGLTPIQEHFLLMRLLGGSDSVARKAALVKKEELFDWKDKDETFQLAYERVCTEPDLLLDQAMKLIQLLAAVRHVEFLSSGDSRERRWAIDTAYKARESGARARKDEAQGQFEKLKADHAQKLVNKEYDRDRGIRTVSGESGVLHERVPVAPGPDNVRDDQA
jgi:hypothetical protein